MDVREMEGADLRFAWDLNQSEVPHVGTETLDAFIRLHAISVYRHLATVDGQPAGFLLGMTSDADYDSPNFLYFRGRYTGFLYVDRIAVAAPFRKLGVGALLYRDAERLARSKGLRRTCCEVNLLPPNPGSMAFHARVGFSKVGEQVAHGKTVAMLVKEL
jgi:predicted GNAT superfamily acetyltransferase